MRGNFEPRLPFRAAAFTVVEILAALLVMAVGIIGIAALYSDQLHSNPETQLHTQAVALASSIAERIRANSDGRAGYAGTVGVVCDREAKPKQSQDAAAQEAACWEDEVERALPSGLGTITRDISMTPMTYVVAVSWSTAETGTASYVIRVVTPES